MNTNHTGVDASNMTDWKEFLEEEREFVESFDFLKDLAIDNPGLYFVLVCTLLNVWFMSYSKCAIWHQYRNCHRTLDVYLLFAIWMGQIQSKLIYIFVTFKLASS